MYLPENLEHIFKCLIPDYKESRQETHVLRAECIKPLFDAAGIEISRLELAEVTKLMDVDRDGEVSEEDFVRSMLYNNSSTLDHEFVDTVFRSFDTDGDGYVMKSLHFVCWVGLFVGVYLSL